MLFFFLRKDISKIFSTAQIRCAVAPHFCITERDKGQAGVTSHQCPEKATLPQLPVSDG
jgi:hypothetical protein